MLSILLTYLKLPVRFVAGTAPRRRAQTHHRSAEADTTRDVRGAAPIGDAIAPTHRDSPRRRRSCDERPIRFAPSRHDALISLI
jgi:hypothetical protein